MANTISEQTMYQGKKIIKRDARLETKIKLKNPQKRQTKFEELK